MSINTKQATELVDKYFNQEFLVSMMKPLLQNNKTSETAAILEYLDSFKIEEFYDKDGNLKSVEDAIFNNPDYADVFKDKPLEEVPEGE
jgi:hypothetical protein